VAIAGPIHVVAVRPTDVSTDGVRRAVVEGEVVDRDWAMTHRLVSWRTDVEVDCASGRVRSPSGDSYPQRRRKGPPTAVFASADWIVPPPGDPTFGVVGAICRADYPWPLRPPRKLTTAQIAQRDARSVPAAPAGPPPDAPIRTAARVVEAAPTPRVQVPPPPPPPAPELGTQYSKAQPASVKTPSRLPAARPIAAQAAAQTSRTPSGRGRFAVQVMASSSEAGARASLERLARVLSVETRGLAPLASPVKVGGRRLYRAMFGGIDGELQARDLC
jgi:hypothetical protein